MLHEVNKNTPDYKFDILAAYQNYNNHNVLAFLKNSLQIKKKSILKVLQHILQFVSMRQTQ